MNIAKNIRIRLSSIYDNGLRTLSTLKLVRKQSGISLQNSAGFAISLPKKCTCCKHRIVTRTLSSSVPVSTTENTWSESSDKDTENIIAKHFKLIQNFITEEEENKLLKEAEKHLKRARYEYDHWDNAIHGYRETEKSRWNDDNKAVLQRVRDAAFEPGVTQLTLVHVLDLAKDGYIKPHVDSVKFCGSTITGLSLLSSSIMRLANEQNPKQWINILLEPRSLYIMTGQARYDYTHEILKNEESIFRGKAIPRDRRISIMCRNEP